MAYTPTPIGELPHATNLNGEELLVVEQNGEAKNATAYELATDIYGISAYDLAVRGGYVGTREEFEQGLAESASYADNAEASAEAAAGSASDASDYKDAASGSASDAAGSATAAATSASQAAQMVNITDFDDNTQYGYAIGVKNGFPAMKIFYEVN